MILVCSLLGLEKAPQPGPVIQYSDNGPHHNSKGAHQGMPVGSSGDPVG